MRHLIFALACLAVPASASGQTLDLNGQMKAMLCDPGSKDFNADACKGLQQQPNRKNSQAPSAHNPALQQRLERERAALEARQPRKLGKPGDPSAVPMPGMESDEANAAPGGAMPSYSGKGCSYARTRPGGASHGGATSACDPKAQGRGRASNGPPPSR